MLLHRSYFGSAGGGGFLFFSVFLIIGNVIQFNHSYREAGYEEGKKGGYRLRDETVG